MNTVDFDKLKPELTDIIVQLANSMPESLGTITFRKVLACKTLRITYDLNISQWCKGADIARQSWYDVHAQPDFGEHCVAVSNKLFGPQTIEVTQALVNKALYGGVDGKGDTTAMLAVLRQEHVIDKTDEGLRNVSDDELRRIARDALGVTPEATPSTDLKETG